MEIGGPSNPQPAVNIQMAEYDAMQPTILYVPTGVDLVEYVVNFATYHNMCIIVVGGLGVLTEATLRETSMGPESPLRTYSETLTLASISGSHVLQSHVPQQPATYFSVVLARMDGTALAGAATRLMTMNDVVLNALAYQYPLVYNASNGNQ